MVSSHYTVWLILPTRGACQKKTSVLLTGHTVCMETNCVCFTDSSTLIVALTDQVWLRVVTGYNDSRIWFVPLSRSLSCMMQKKSVGKRAMQNFFLQFIYVNTRQTTSIPLSLEKCCKMLPATLKVNLEVQGNHIMF